MSWRSALQTNYSSHPITTTVAAAALATVTSYTTNRILYAVTQVGSNQRGLGREDRAPAVALLRDECSSANGVLMLLLSTWTLDLPPKLSVSSWLSSRSRLRNSRTPV